jgi:hypothetical protein
MVYSESQGGELGDQVVVDTVYRLVIGRNPDERGLLGFTPLFLNPVSVHPVRISVMGVVITFQEDRLPVVDEPKIKSESGITVFQIRKAGLSSGGGNPEEEGCQGILLLDRSLLALMGSQVGNPLGFFLSQAVSIAVPFLCSEGEGTLLTDYNVPRKLDRALR